MNGIYGGFDPFAVEPFVEVPNIGTEALGIAGVMLGIFAVFYLAALAFSIVLYVLQSIGIYTVAKRRGIHNPWLAWLPVGVLWILGSISDQYQYLVKGRVRNRRKILLGVSIAMLALLIAAVGAVVALIVAAVIGESVATAGISALVMALCYLAVVVLTIILLVYTYIAMYDLYVSCDPGNATTYLVLSILFNVSQPFFMFFSRKKDLGMPPRKEETQCEVHTEQPVTEEIPTEPVCEEIPETAETPEETE